MPNFDDLRRAFEDELSYYGQYLAMRGAQKGEQRFGFPELALAALVITFWAGKQLLQSYLQEKGKLLAQPKNKTDEQLTANIQLLLDSVRGNNRKLSELEEAWIGLCKQLPSHMPAQIAPNQVNHEELLALLTDLGLSQRTARKASISILVHIQQAAEDENDPAE